MRQLPRLPCSVWVWHNCCKWIPSGQSQ